MMKLSAIIPVYNVERYLRICLDSVVNQNCESMEIIVVNDGSTDGSEQICREYAQKYDNILLISGPNYGVSHARNQALEVASGEYVLFIDADDCLAEQALVKLDTVCRKADLILSGFQRVDEEGQPLNCVSDFAGKQISQEDMLQLVLAISPQMGYQGYLWNKLFRNEIIQTHRIRFDETIRYNEDRLFITEYLLHSQDAFLFPEITYAYRIRSDSAMGAVKQTSAYKPAVLTELDAFEKIFRLLQQAGSPSYGYALKGAFYRSYYLLPNIPADRREDRVRVLTFKKDTYKKCMRDPVLSVKNKLKIFIFQNIYKRGT